MIILGVIWLVIAGLAFALPLWQLPVAGIAVVVAVLFFRAGLKEHRRRKIENGDRKEIR